MTLRRLTAIHEAAHAVVALALGKRIRCVSIESDETGARGLAWVEGLRDRTPDDVRDKLTIALAGDVGVSILTREPICQPSGTDAEKVRQCRARLTDGAEVVRAERVARSLLEQRWHFVERLSAALLREGHLCRSQVIGALNSPSHDPTPDASA